jgi:hypothetical protein
MTSIERVRLYNREYRKRVNSEKTKKIDHGSIEKDEQMKKEWLKHNKITICGSTEAQHCTPSPMIINSATSGMKL